MAILQISIFYISYFSLVVNKYLRKSNSKGMKFIWINGLRCSALWRKCYGGRTSSFPWWQKNIVHILAFQKQRKENTSIRLALLLITFVPSATLDCYSMAGINLIYGKSVFPLNWRVVKGRSKKGMEAEKMHSAVKKNEKVPIDT